MFNCKMKTVKTIEKLFGIYIFVQKPLTLRFDIRISNLLE